MLTEKEKFVAEQIGKIHRELKILKTQWDRMVEAVGATPFLRNLKTLDEQQKNTYQLCIKIAGENVPIL